MDTPIVRIENLSHRYSVQWAVRDINLEIRQHGIYGLLGSNGAGKSTIMNIMCGVLKQTEGDIYIKGINTRIDPVGKMSYWLSTPTTPFTSGFDGGGIFRLFGSVALYPA